MAIRYRAGRKTPWQVYWNNPHTKKREYANFLTEEEAKKEDSLVKHRLRFDRESFPSVADEQTLYEKDHQQQENTLEAVYLQYLRQIQPSKHALSVQMDCMRLALSMIGATPIEQIDEAVLRNVLHVYSEKGVKASSLQRRLGVLRTVLRWAAEQGFCKPIRFPKLPSVHYEKIVPPTPEELAAMMRVAPPHIQRVIVLGSQLGVRVGPSELLGLTWDDVDFSQRCVKVHGAKKNKNREWRLVPIRDNLVEVFRQWKMQDGGAGHLVTVNGRAIRSIKTAWHATLAKAGITRRIRPYDLRHAFGTYAIANGADLGTVADLMGHADIKMLTKHYQHVLYSQKRAAVEALPDLFYVPSPMCQ